MYYRWIRNIPIQKVHKFTTERPAIFFRCWLRSWIFIFYTHRISRSFLHAHGLKKRHFMHLYYRPTKLDPGDAYKKAITYILHTVNFLLHNKTQKIRNDKKTSCQKPVLTRLSVEAKSTGKLSIQRRSI